MEYVIEIAGLTKKYGTYAAVDNLDLKISKGEIFGLLGPNGAGKSTTILMLMGLTEPNAGTVKVCGTDSVRQPIDVKRKVGYLPEDVGFYEDHTGLENLVFTARLNGFTRKTAETKAFELLEKVGLARETTKKAGKYSRGMKQRLGLADVLIKNPEVIILDEPTLGIDPKGVKEFLELIVRLSRKEGITVLFSSHHLYQVQQVCDRVGIFVSGKLLAEGNVNSLAEQLFSTSAFTIEAGIAPDSASTTNGRVTNNEVVKKIKEIEGVIEVIAQNNHFEIECKTDLAPQIAKTIVDTGAGLQYLNRKEYGLDDIYYKYFEGGQ